MRIAAFESPLIAKASQRAYGMLTLAAFPTGDLDAHKSWELQGGYVAVAEGSDALNSASLTGYTLNTDLQSWGVAQIELDYHEDLVLAYQRDEALTQCYTLPVKAHTRAYVAPCPAFDSLAALLAYIRRYFTIDTQLYWGKTSQGYVGIALHALIDPVLVKSALKFPDPPFTPLFDLHLAQPYSPLSSQLMEAAGTEWALRALPESISDELKDPRPIVTLGAQPYYQRAVSQLLLKTSRWTRVASATQAARQAEKSTRSVWETFLVPHQELEGYLEQWQEILYRFLPLYCQWSERLAQQSEILQKKQILTPYFERSVTPMGRLAQEMESLRGLAQARLLQQTQQAPESNTLTARELLKGTSFFRRWQLFLNDYGHCGALDLAQPRLHEQQEQWLNTLLTPWCEGRPLSDLSWPQRLWAGVLWRDYQQLYHLREKLWSDTLWALDQVKRRMLAKLNEAADESSESLPFVALCHPPVEGLMSEAADQAGDETESVQLQQPRQPPSAVMPEPALAIERLHGIGLDTGLAQGLLWHADPSATRLPEGYLPTQTILCLREVEAVHLPLIQQVAGVLLTHSNPWSQGSHLLREWHRPAIVQVADAHQLPEGTPIRLNSDLGVVDVLDSL